MPQEERTDFWSRRKAAVRAEADAMARPVTAEVDGPAAATAEIAEKPDAEILESLGLPDPESLAAGDDFSAFMRAAVPEHLRRRALRKLWLTNPTLANVDGLVDYGGDFTDAATVFPGMQTAYQVGKGMLKHVLSSERELDEGEEAADAGLTPATSAADEPAPVEAHIPDDVIIDAEASEATDLAEADVAEVQCRPRRHMRFAFAD